MALYLDVATGTGKERSVTRRPLMDGGFGEIPLADAVSLSKAEVFKPDGDWRFRLRILTPIRFP